MNALNTLSCGLPVACCQFTFGKKWPGLLFITPAEVWSERFIVDCDVLSPPVSVSRAVRCDAL